MVAILVVLDYRMAVMRWDTCQTLFADSLGRELSVNCVKPAEDE